MNNLTYVEVPLPSQQSELWSKTIGVEDTQVYNLLNTKMCVALLPSTNPSDPIFNGMNKMNQLEAIALVQSDKYIDYNLVP